MIPLAELVARQTLGRVRAAAGQLRRPWFLVPSVLGAGFAVYALAVVLAAVSWASPVGLHGLLGTLALWGVAGGWMAAAARPAPSFSRAELQLLAPAPLTRRQLLAYRVLRAQPGFLALAAVFGVAAGDARLPHHTAFAGVWLALNAGLLHQLGASLTLARVRQLGGPRWLTTLPAAILVGALAMIVVISAPPSPSLDASARELLSWSDAMWHVSPAQELLRPMRLLVELPLARDEAAFLQALPGALLVIAVLGLWVGLIIPDFVELATAVADDRQDEEDDGAVGRWLPSRWPVPALAPTGPFWRALAWRGLVGLARRVQPGAVASVLAVNAAVALAWSISQGLQPDQNLSQSVSGLAVALVVLGPSLMALDLRQDLGRLDVLRAWPVPGASLVRGGLIAPIGLTSALHVILIAGATSASDGDPLQRAAAFAGGIIALPGATALAFAIANLLALWFPGLERRGDGARGIEAVGRLIVGTTLRNAVLWIALLPAWAGLAVGLAAGGALGLDQASFFPAGAMFGLIAGAEAEIVVRMAGRRLDRRQ